MEKTVSARRFQGEKVHCPRLSEAFRLYHMDGSEGRLRIRGGHHGRAYRVDRRLCNHS
jgi:hypothetical protein